MPKEITVNNVILIFPDFFVSTHYAYYYFKTKCYNAIIVPTLKKTHN